MSTPDSPAGATGPRLLVIGGGAAGFFGAVAAAEAEPRAKVFLYEATAHPLAKVRVSGGGRCNVTHACFEPRALSARYPRGGRELLGAFTRFGPRDTVDWFEARGVALKAEEDGRMFPVTDDSATIVGALRSAADQAGVRLFTGMGVRAVSRLAAETGGGFEAVFSDGSASRFDRVLLATCVVMSHTCSTTRSSLMSSPRTTATATHDSDAGPKKSGNR